MTFTKEDQKAWIENYQKEHITRMVIKLNDKTDQDILEHMKTIGEKRQTYIKRLIREDMAKSE